MLWLTMDQDQQLLPCSNQIDHVFMVADDLAA